MKIPGPSWVDLSLEELPRRWEFIAASQWKPDEEPGPQAWPPRERAALQEELSDVLIYLVALAARCRVDLPRAVLSKMDTNRRRYPAHLSRGSARKYTDLPHGATSENQAVGPADLACESTGQAST
ncbi:dCTP pyrophosphatase 1, partial [Eschrichtius robustus]|nr:dCTP pyrophosphatase 1 [Eschrichtius robustus]